MSNGEDQGNNRPRNFGAKGAWKPRLPLGNVVLAQQGAPKKRDPRPSPKNRKPPKSPAKKAGVLTEKQAIMAVKSSDLELIPRIMDRENWTVGAQLMRHWFSGSAFTISADQSVNTPANEDIVTLNWVLSKSDEFEAARDAYDDILNNSSANYKTRNSNAELVKSLQDDSTLQLKEMKIGETKSFNHYISGAKTSGLHPKHIQSKMVDAGTAGNKLVASLARFNFHLLARGEVTVVDSRQIRVTIKGVGVYVRDSYDFTDDAAVWYLPASQRLGCWDFQKMKYYGRTNAWGSSTVLCVDNKSFRDWRTKRNKGGDFRIFSDIRDIEVKPHFSFDIQSKYTFSRPKD